jgi:pentapeptide repeat protein
VKNAIRAAAKVANVIFFYAKGLWPLALVVGVAGLAWLASSLGWEFWSEKIKTVDGVEIKTDRLKIIQQFFLGFAAFAALVLALVRTAAAHRQANTALRQTDIAQRSQHVDRYAKAANLLDSAQLPVRLAGLYALRELALADPEGSRTVCLQLLSGFTRLRSRETEAPSNVEGFSLPEDLKVAIVAISSVMAQGPPGVRPTKDDLDLSDVILCRSAFGNLCLDGIFLMRADCRRSFFTGASFKQTSFFNSKFVGANFSICAFVDTSFRSCSVDDLTFFACLFEGRCSWPLPGVEWRFCGISGLDLNEASDLKPEQFIDCWIWTDEQPLVPDGTILKKVNPGPNGQIRREFRNAVANWRTGDPLPFPKEIGLSRGYSPPAS